MLMFKNSRCCFLFNCPNPAQPDISYRSLLRTNPSSRRTLRATQKAIWTRSCSIASHSNSTLKQMDVTELLKLLFAISDKTGKDISSQKTPNLHSQKKTTNLDPNISITFSVISRSHFVAKVYFSIQAFRHESISSSTWSWLNASHQLTTNPYIATWEKPLSNILPWTLALMCGSRIY